MAVAYRGHTTVLTTQGTYVQGSGGWDGLQRPREGEAGLYSFAWCIDSDSSIDNAQGRFSYPGDEQGCFASGGASTISIAIDSAIPLQSNAAAYVAIGPPGAGSSYYYVVFDIVDGSPPADPAPCACTTTLNWPPPQGDVTAALTATPDTLTAGEVTTLTYGTTGAHSAAIDNGVGPVPPPSGSVPAAPTASLTYTLDALGDWLTHASATADVAVGAPSTDPGDPAPLDCLCDWQHVAVPPCTGWVPGGGGSNFGTDME